MPTNEEINFALAELWLLRDNIFWKEDAEGSDLNEQHRIDPAITVLQRILKERTPNGY